MSYLISQIIPSLQTLKILGDTNAFEMWLKKFHRDKENKVLFEGYRFSLNCCLNSFLDGISNDQLLSIENDFLLNRVIVEMVPIHKIEDTCEKTVFLKTIKPIIKSILKANNYKEIKVALAEFELQISSKFDFILDNCITISPEIDLDKQTAINLWLINFAHTYMVQINNNGPIANIPNPLSVEWTNQEMKERYLEGYKYTIQYLWNQLLGDEKFNQTHLSKLHLADSWREYNYIKKEKTDNPFFNKEFSLEEQTNFDSYCYWIDKEITNPLHDQYKTPINSIDSYFQFSDEKYNKNKLFENLLDKTKIKGKPTLNWQEKIEQCLYWYSFELVDSYSSKMHFGISSFNTMLAGTVTLHNPKESEFSKIVVAKFIHPFSKDGNKNDYSYGILIDSKSAAGHYSSGWVIYQNACGDYSGFSGMEHKSTEKLIENYKKENRIELRVLIIPLNEFKDFTAKHTLNHEQLSILEQNKLIPDIIQKSRAHLFELFTYYVCTKYYAEGFKIDFNTDRNTSDGEKDVVLSNDDEVILIECKLNPQSYNIPTLLEKMEKKLQTFSQQSKSCQFWFWFELSPQNKTTLDNAKINNKDVKTIIVSSTPTKEPILKGVYLKQLRMIMQDYNRQTEIDFDSILNKLPD